MAEAVRNPQPEYWHHPVAPAVPSPSPMAVACDGCGAEFMVGAQFCHVCGRSRQALPSAQASWKHHFAFLRALEFHNVQSWLALPLGSLITFLIGVACILGALVVGLVYNPQSAGDLQELQLWRIEWLLGAVAAFLAGILLKRADPRS